MVLKKYIEERKFVSKLIFKVLTGSLCVREAILKFPADVDDSSLKAAYHSLVHYEADEDLRHRDLLYKDEQDEYLELIAQTLERGEDLPSNVVRGYEMYYKNAGIPYSKNMKGFLKSLCKFLNV